MIDLKALIKETRLNQINGYEQRASEVISNYERILKSKIQNSPRETRWSSYLGVNTGESKDSFMLFYNYLIDNYVTPKKTQMTIEFILPNDDEAIYDYYILFSIGV